MRMDHVTLNVSPAPGGSGEGNAEEKLQEAPLQELDLSELEGYPVEVKEDQKTRSILIQIKNHPVARKATLIGAGALGMASTVAPVAAEDINWSSIGSMFDGVATLMPSVSTLIMAVVPIIILLVVVGFLTGLLDGIVKAVTDSISFMKK